MPYSQDRVSPNNFPASFSFMIAHDSLNKILAETPKVGGIFKARNLGILKHLPPVAVAVSIVPNLRQPPGVSKAFLRTSS